MLAARGVSLGLGKDINFSDLNQLNFADRALLGKLQKLKRKKEAEQPKFVVKKHVDSKTLFVACLTVIIGSVIIILGLVATVAGYFDKELSDDIVIDSTVTNSNGDPEMVSKLSWSTFLLKSLQYVGPILMGIGMFLLIIACVITLESRDRHTQIIQEESTEIRRSKNRQLQQKQQITVISSAATKTSLIMAHDDSQINGKRRRLAGPLTPPLPKHQPTTPNGLSIVRSATFGAKHLQNRTSASRAVDSYNKCQPTKEVPAKNDLLVKAEVHEVVQDLPQKLLRQVISTHSFSTDDDPSTSDAMAVYGPTRRDNVFSITLEGAKPIVRTKKRRRHSILEESPSLAEKKPALLPQPKSDGNLAKYHIPPLLIINTRTPKGPAPIVRVDSIVELSSISTSPPPSSLSQHLTDRQSVV